LESARALDRTRRARHRTAALLPLACNIAPPVFAPRQLGACRRMIMEFVAIVMLGSVALWFSQQFERHDW
jgi:hypothetical protein